MALVYMQVCVCVCVGARSLYNVLQEEARVTQHLGGRHTGNSAQFTVNKTQSGLCLSAKHIFALCEKSPKRLSLLPTVSVPVSACGLEGRFFKFSYASNES